MTQAWLVGGDPGATAAALVLDDDAVRITWTGVGRAGLSAAGLAAAGLAGTGAGSALLVQQADGAYCRPTLAAHRPDGTGSAWSPALRTTSVTETAVGLDIYSLDEVAGVAVRTEVESVSGGLRARHTVTNTASAPLVVDALEVGWPADPTVAEVLDFTGRHIHERTVQRHRITDGEWVRENRAGKTGLGSATELVVGPVGFGFARASVHAIHVAWSGNHVHRVERAPDGSVTLWGGELLLPGEIVLDEGGTYATPWVHLFASDDGLDGLAALVHHGLRAGQAHPRGPRPVTFNAWEAVYFDHSLDRLTELARLAARVGVERFVLDDGWFGSRRDDTSGLGDWTVSADVWPDGLGPIADIVTGLGMELGLWFEPEMVNPDSDLYRAHPDWVLATGDRLPPPQRHQLVLDLGRAEVRDHLLEAISGVLQAYPISFVKWDHNRDLADGGSGLRAGGPGVHAQTLGFYDLLDRLRARHPDAEWESCASGGGRIDLAVLSRVQRVWTSDMTDALARQDIQRWTAQLVPLEMMGAHISATQSHQSGRVLPLALRAVTALFGHLGIEWDLSAASTDELAELTGWVGRYREHRALLHSGRLFRGDLPDDVADALRVQGVVALDGSAALVSCVRLTTSPRGLLPVRVPGLLPDRRYTVHEQTASTGEAIATLTGADLAAGGLVVTMGRPGEARLLHIAAAH